MERFAGWLVGTLVAWVVLGVIAMMLLWTPLIGPWEQERAGEAELARATQNRQILVQQAEAEAEAAKKRAQAIETVGAMAAKYPQYRQQEFIGAFADAIKDGRIQKMIFVPTENNIPIVQRVGPTP